MTAPIRTLEGMAHQLRLRGLPAEITLYEDDLPLCVVSRLAPGVALTFVRQCARRMRHLWLVTTEASPIYGARWYSDAENCLIPASGVPSVLADAARRLHPMLHDVDRGAGDADMAHALRAAIRRLDPEATP